MPEFQRGNSIAYLNPAPPLDARAASVYAISPPAKDWTIAGLKASSRNTTGTCSSYSQSTKLILVIMFNWSTPTAILPCFAKFLSSGVFAEGWAVYTEQMMVDQGYGKGDLPLRLNQLKWYLRAVANAILDNKMHCANMSDEEAMQLLVGRAFQSEEEARLKVIRSKQSSCQLSTYFAGRTAFYRLRQKVQREIGEQFELGRFHEAVLDHGTLPVKFLPEIVRERLKQPR